MGEGKLVDNEGVLDCAGAGDPRAPFLRVHRDLVHDRQLHEIEHLHRE